MCVCGVREEEGGGRSLSKDIRFCALLLWCLNCASVVPFFLSLFFLVFWDRGRDLSGKDYNMGGSKVGRGFFDGLVFLGRMCVERDLGGFGLGRF